MEFENYNLHGIWELQLAWNLRITIYMEFEKYNLNRIWELQFGIKFENLQFAWTYLRITYQRLKNLWTYQKFCSILLFFWIFNWSIYLYSFVSICGVKQLLMVKYMYMIIWELCLRYVPSFYEILIRLFEILVQVYFFLFVKQYSDGFLSLLYWICTQTSKSISSEISVPSHPTS